MSDSERDTDPAAKDDTEALPDGPLTPEEAESDPAYEPDNEELKRLKGG